jgi:hypothetical protein
MLVLFLVITWHFTFFLLTIFELFVLDTTKAF